MPIYSSFHLSQDQSDSNDLGPLPSDAQGESVSDANPPTESEVGAAQTVANETAAIVENSSAPETGQTVAVDPNVISSDLTQQVSFFEDPLSLLWLLPLLLTLFLWRLLRAFMRRDPDLGEIAEVRGEFTKSDRFSLAGAGVNRESFEKSLDEFDAQTPSNETGETSGQDELAASGQSDNEAIDKLNEGNERVSEFMVNESEDDATELGSEDEFDFSAEIDELTEQVEKSAEQAVELADQEDSVMPIHEELDLSASVDEVTANSQTALPVGVAAANQLQPFAQTDSARLADVDSATPITEDEFEFDEDQLFDDDDSAADLTGLISDEGSTFDASIENNAELEEEIRANELNKDNIDIAATISPSNSDDEEALMNLHDDDSDLELNFDFSDDVDLGDADAELEMEGSTSQLGAIANSEGGAAQLAESVIAEPNAGQAEDAELSAEAFAATLSIDDSAELDEMFEDSGEDLGFGLEADDEVSNSVNQDVSSTLAGPPNDVVFNDDDSLGIDEEFDFDADSDVDADAEPANGGESVLDESEDEVADDHVFGSLDPFDDDDEIADSLISEMTEPVADAVSNAIESPIESAMETESVTDSLPESGADVGTAVMAAGTVAATAASGSLFSRLFGWFKKKPKVEIESEEQLEPVVAVDDSEPIESTNELNPSDAATEFAIEAENELAIHAETLVVENDEFDLDELESENGLEMDGEVKLDDEVELEGAAEQANGLERDNEPVSVGKDQLALGGLADAGNEDDGEEFDFSDDSQAALDVAEDEVVEAAAIDEPFELEAPFALEDGIESESAGQANLIEVSEPTASIVETESEQAEDSAEALAANLDEAFELDDVDELSFDDEPAIAGQSNAVIANTEPEVTVDTPIATDADTEAAFAELDVANEIDADTANEDSSEVQSGLLGGVTAAAAVAGLAGTVAFAGPSNDQVDAELKQANEANAALEAELNSIRAKLETATQENANLNSELDSANSELTSTISELDGKNTELNTTVMNLENKNSELSTTLLDLENKKAELAELNLRVEQLKEQAPPVESEPDAQPAEAPRKKMSKADMAASDPELYYRFKKRLKSEHRKRKESQVFLSQAEEQRDEIAKALRSAKAELNELVGANELASTDATLKLESELAEQAEKLTSAEVREAELLQLVADHKSELELSKENLALSESTLKEIEANATDAEQRKIVAEGKCLDLEALSTSFQTKLANSESRVAELESKTSASTELEAELKSAKDELESLQSNLKSLESKTTESDANLADALSRAVNAESSLKAVEALLVEAKTKVEQADAKVTQASSIQTELDEKNKLADQLAFELEAGKTSAESRDAELQAALASVHGLKSEVSALKSASDDSEKLAQEIQRLKSELELSSEKRDDSMNQLVDQATKFEDERQSLTAQILASKNEPAQNQIAEIKKLESELSQSLTSRSELKELLSSSEEKLEESATKFRAAEETRETERQQLSQLTNQLAAAEKRTQELNEAVKLAESKAATVQTEMFESANADVEKQLRLELRDQEKRIVEVESEHRNALDEIERLTKSAGKKSSKTGSKTKSAGKVVSFKPEDLTQIVGIGPAIQKKLKNAGVNSIEQIAGWSNQDASEIEEKLSFKGRVAKDDWITQAKALVRDIKKVGQ